MGRASVAVGPKSLVILRRKSIAMDDMKEAYTAIDDLSIVDVVAIIKRDEPR